MANSLHRDIEPGEILVLKEDIFTPAYQAVQYRTVKALGGFGMKAYTSGTALFVEFLCDGEQTRVDGFDVDAEETEKAQQEAQKKKNGQHTVLSMP